MNLIKPKKLQKGDTIAILATSGSIEDDTCLIRAKKYFEDNGYNVEIGKNIFSKCRYLAGTDFEKIEELHRLFENEKINAIICLRGGYGSIRLIDKINYEIIKNNPKIFVGYSDITALSAMFLKKSNLITFSGPMIQSDFGQETLSEFTMNSFFKTLSTDTKQTFISNKIYKSGEANGITFGGNLATLTSLCGIDFIPDENFIFFTEDLNEPVYKIDKMMTQLLNIEKFRNNLSAIILGDFLNIDNEKWFDELFYEIGEKLKKPIIAGLKITHAKDKLTIPYGIPSKILNNEFIY